jgi:deoxycytidylate deaminase
VIGFLLIRSLVFYVPNKYSVHAEQDCINNLKNKSILKDCILIVIKINQGGSIINSEPCNNCCRIIKKYKIKKTISS